MGEGTESTFRSTAPPGSGATLSEHPYGTTPPTPGHPRLPGAVRAGQPLNVAESEPLEPSRYAIHTFDVAVGAHPARFTHASQLGSAGRLTR